jgi:predicted GIY-YIG superfamily endonuclease
VYLLHFDQRYEHAGHYTGKPEDLDRRQAEHQQGRGARLVEVITQAGISFRLARVWPGVTRARERQLKRQGGASRRCPICLDECATPARGRMAGPRAPAVPTRGTTPTQARAFFALNEAFARPVGASPAKQWGRVRGREQLELLTPRVTRRVV